MRELQPSSKGGSIVIDSPDLKVDPRESQSSILFPYAGCPKENLHNSRILVRDPIKGLPISLCMIGLSRSHSRSITRNEGGVLLLLLYIVSRQVTLLNFGAV